MDLFRFRRLVVLLLLVLRRRGSRRRGESRGWENIQLGAFLALVLAVLLRAVRALSRGNLDTIRRDEFSLFWAVLLGTD